MISRKKRHFVFTMVVVILTSASASAQYTFRNMGDSNSGYFSVSDVALNDSGSVAFKARLTPNGSVQGVVRVSAVGAATVIARNDSGPFAGYGFGDGNVVPVSINNAGRVAFVAERATPTNTYYTDRGVFLSDGTTLTTISAPGNATPIGGLQAQFPVRVNNVGTVIFQASSSTTSSSTTGVYAGNGGLLTTIATSSQAAYPAASSINDAGTAVYRTDTQNSTSTIILRTAAGVSTTVASAGTGGQYTGFPNASAGALIPRLDAAGRVYFFAQESPTTNGVYRWENGVTTRLLTGSYNAIPFSVNNSGQVLSSLGNSLYVGTDGNLTRVVGVGDSLDGSTVNGFFLGSDIFNTAGQVAFVAVLADGRQAVVVATPVPEPTGVVLLAAVGLGTIRGLRRRMRRRRFDGEPSHHPLSVNICPSFAT